MAISRFGAPNLLGANSTRPGGVGLFAGPQASQLPTALKPPSPPSQPNAPMQPAGLPPDAWVDVANPLKKKSMKPKPGALNSQAPRRISPTPANQASQDALLQHTQRTDQLQPDQVMGMNNQDWQHLLSQFGVFA